MMRRRTESGRWAALLDMAGMVPTLMRVTVSSKAKRERSCREARAQEALR